MGNGTSRLDPGEVLHVNGQLIPPSSLRFVLLFQADGNLVLYENPGWENNVYDPLNYRPLWATDTVGKPSKTCDMQYDGNLVIYDQNRSPLWGSGTVGYQGSNLRLQDDGNLVIYNSDNSPVWATNTVHEVVSYGPPPTGPIAGGDHIYPGQILTAGNSITSANQQFGLSFQYDGNLVLYRNLERNGIYNDAASLVPLWSTGTHGSPTVCIMQEDGDLVIYDKSGSPKWRSGTAGNPGSNLAVQDDGNLVIYRPDYSAAWATGTN